MKKKIALTIFLLIIILATNVFATTQVNMEIVEDNVCTIDINENCSFEKKIVDSKLENHEVTLQLQITNNSEVVIPSGELMFVIDSSFSMTETVEEGTTRKDLVLNSANKLVKSLLEANPTTLKIGVVTFSSSSEKNDEGFLITGTAADAQKVCDLTNDLTMLTTQISAIEGSGQYTNLDSGLQLASKQFTDTDTNKYMVILTDGLPNLAVGFNDLVTYDGLTDVITQTKSTLTSLKDVKVITMLTGISNENATFREDGTNTYSYTQVIEEVFGTEENSTNGIFYKIADADIENTITDTIYRDLLPIEKSLENIIISDYFPKYITNNFDITLHIDNESDTENITLIFDEQNTQHIVWKLDKLSSNESKTIKYTLSLKKDFDESIIGKILDTNEKVDINYKNFDGTDKSENSTVTPKVKLSVVTQPPADDTVAPEPMPDAGSPAFAIAFILILCFATAWFSFKSNTQI